LVGIFYPQIWGFVVGQSQQKNAKDNTLRNIWISPQELGKPTDVTVRG
jgi:hypothetical protein